MSHLTSEDFSEIQSVCKIKTQCALSITNLLFEVLYLEVLYMHNFSFKINNFLLLSFLVSSQHVFKKIII